VKTRKTIDVNPKITLSRSLSPSKLFALPVGDMVAMMIEDPITKTQRLATAITPRRVGGGSEAGFVYMSRDSRLMIPKVIETMNQNLTHLVTPKTFLRASFS